MSFFWAPCWCAGIVQTYYKLTIEECVQIGVKSIALVALVATFIGAVTTVQTAYNMVRPTFLKHHAQVVREMAVLELGNPPSWPLLRRKSWFQYGGWPGHHGITEQIDALEVMESIPLPTSCFRRSCLPPDVSPAGITPDSGSLFGGYLVGSLANTHNPTGFHLWTSLFFRFLCNHFCMIKSLCSPS